MKTNIMKIVHISAIVILIGGLILFNCSSTKNINESDALVSRSANTLMNKVVFSTMGNKRVVMSNSIPKNFVNTFPNNHNPNSPTSQNITISMPLSPKKGTNTIMGTYTELGDNYINTGLEFRTAGKRFTTIGIAVDGVMIEPGTAEVWNPDAGRRGRVQEVSDIQWSYDGLGAQRRGTFVGMDMYKGHVQPTGLYHYHAITTETDLFVDDESVASPIVAFAADGFPIFGPYGYDESGEDIIKMYGNYKLKDNGGTRQARGGQNPGGSYDGTFEQDYMFAAGEADVDVLEGGDQVSILDIANGHIGKVPADEMERYKFSKEYLGVKNENDNTYEVYHYHITPNYPYMPRMLYGMPDDSFLAKDNMRSPQDTRTKNDARLKEDDKPQRGSHQGGRPRRGGGRL